MPDHIHFFAGFAPGAVDLSTWIKSLKNALSKCLRSNGIPGPHWQKGFFDHILRTEESYACKWKYVRMNPVRAGLVRDPGDWKFQGEIFTLDSIS
jgi:REP element-mobilizing transposase RayT